MNLLLNNIYATKIRHGEINKSKWIPLNSQGFQVKSSMIRD